MSEELKPCPFCGSEAYIWNIRDWGEPPLFIIEVGCEKCDVHFRKCRETLEEAKSRAIEAWNRRVK